MAAPNFRNRTLYHGDNLPFLRGMALHLNPCLHQKSPVCPKPLFAPKPLDKRENTIFYVIMFCRRSLKP